VQHYIAQMSMYCTVLIQGDEFRHILFVVYRVPATDTRSPRIAYRQSLRSAGSGMWPVGDGLCPRRLQASVVKMASTF